MIERPSSVRMSGRAPANADLSSIMFSFMSVHAWLYNRKLILVTVLFTTQVLFT